MIFSPVSFEFVTTSKHLTNNTIDYSEITFQKCFYMCFEIKRCSFQFFISEPNSDHVLRVFLYPFRYLIYEFRTLVVMASVFVCFCLCYFCKTYTSANSILIVPIYTCVRYNFCKGWLISYIVVCIA